MSVQAVPSSQAGPARARVGLVPLVQIAIAAVAVSVSLAGCGPSEPKSAGVVFMVLSEGKFRFEGTVEELLASKDPFLERFLFMTLPPW